MSRRAPGAIGGCVRPPIPAEELTARKPGKLSVVGADNLLRSRTFSVSPLRISSSGPGAPPVYARACALCGGGARPAPARGGERPASEPPAPRRARRSRPGRATASTPRRSRCCARPTVPRLSPRPEALVESRPSRAPLSIMSRFETDEAARSLLRAPDPPGAWASARGPRGERSHGQVLFLRRPDRRLGLCRTSGVAACHRGQGGPRNLIGSGGGDIHNCAGGLYQGLISEDPEFRVFRWRARRKLI